MVNWIKNYIDKKFQEREERYNKRFNQAVDNIYERVLSELPQTVENILNDTLWEIHHVPEPKGFVRTFKEGITPFIRRALELELKELRKKHQRLYELKIDAKKIIENAPKDEKFIQRVIDEINKKQLKK